MKLSCVILTMGDRPAELDRAIESTGALRGDGVDLVVVGNGADVPPVPDGVKTIRLPENVELRLAATLALMPAPVTWSCSLTTMAGISTRGSGSMSPAGSQPIRSSP